MAEARFTIVNIGTLSTNKFWGETERIHPVSATCTLLVVDGLRIIVDPSPYPEPLAQKLFDTTGLRPDAIDMVYVTHVHGDHRFGIDLFAGKPWLTPRAELDGWKAQVPNERHIAERFLPAEQHVPSGVALMPSPGHTLGLGCLVADTSWGRLVIAGDAVMTLEYFDAEEGFPNSKEFRLATESIRNIKRAADIVVPGHGNYILNRR